MPGIRSFLCEFFAMFVRITKKSYRSCVVVMTGTVAVAVVALNSTSFGACGKNKLGAPHRIVICDEDEPGETDTEAKIQAGIEVVLYAEENLDEISKSLNVTARVTECVVGTNEEQLPDETAEEVSKIEMTEEDRESLEKLIEAEASGEDLKGKILVGNVVMNRVNNEEFPNSVKDVIFHIAGGDRQFSPVADGRYYSVEVSQETKEAVDCILNGEDYSEGALYFSARDKADTDNMRWFDTNLKWLFKYGGHEFYTNF